MPRLVKDTAVIDALIAFQPNWSREVLQSVIDKVPTVAFIVDEKKWEEAQDRAEEFWDSEEGQKRKQEMRACAASFRELMETGQTTVRVVSGEEN